MAHRVVVARHVHGADLLVKVQIRNLGQVVRALGLVIRKELVAVPASRQAPQAAAWARTLQKLWAAKVPWSREVLVAAEAGRMGLSRVRAR